MTSHTLHVPVAALLAAAAPLAGAHEFACEKTAGVLRLTPSGTPVTDPGGLPVFVAPPSRILTLRSYPAVVGFRIRLQNLESETSVVTGVRDPLLGAAGTMTFGAAIAPGLALPVGEEATEVFAVSVGSREDCLWLFGAAPTDAPMCTDVRENRFVVEHDIGSAECRANVVCAAPQVGCGDLWHGIKQFGYGSGTGIALENACDLAVVATDPAVPSGVLTRLDEAGDLTQTATFGLAPRPPATQNVVVDAAGDRWVAWTRPVVSVFDEAIASRFAPDGTETLRFVVENSTVGNPPPFARASGIAVDALGNGYLVGGAEFGPLPGFVVQGGTGAFAVKIDAATGAAVWKLQFGDRAVARANVVLPDGVLLVVGDTGGAMPGNVNAGARDAFIARIAPDGNFASAAQLGTADDESATAVALDAAGNVYVAGNVGKPLGDGAADVRAFLAKLDAGLHLLWYRELASSAQGAFARGVAVDVAGSAWIAGSAIGALPGQADGVGERAFAARYDAAGNLQWVNQFGPPDARTLAFAVAVDALDEAYVTGSTTASLGGDTAGWFVAKFGPTGSLK